MTSSRDRGALRLTRIHLAAIVLLTLGTFVIGALGAASYSMSPMGGCYVAKEKTLYMLLFGHGKVVISRMGDIETFRVLQRLWGFEWQTKNKKWFVATGGYEAGLGQQFRLFSVAKVSVWVIVVACGAYPAALIVRRAVKRKKRSKPGTCVQCGYDLRGLQEPRCPECGTVSRNRP